MSDLIAWQKRISWRMTLEGVEPLLEYLNSNQKSKTIIFFFRFGNYIYREEYNRIQSLDQF